MILKLREHMAYLLNLKKHNFYKKDECVKTE